MKQRRLIIFSAFQILAESIGLTEKRFYMFLQSSKIPLDKMWNVIYELLGEEMLENGKIIIALDDTTYGKSGQFLIYGKIRKCEYAEFKCMHKGFKAPVKIAKFSDVYFC